MNIQTIVGNRVIRALLLILLLSAAAALVLRRPDQLTVLVRLGPVEIAALLAVNLLSFLMTATVSWHLLRAVGAEVPWHTNLALTYLANFLNYFGPAQPGLGAKALYLKSMRQVPFTSFAVITATNALVMVLIAGGMGGLLIGWIRLTSGVLLTELGVLSLGMMSGVLVLPWIIGPLQRLTTKSGRLVQLVGNAVRGMKDLGQRRRSMAISAQLVVVQYLVAGLAIWLSYQAIGVELPYSASLLIAVFLSVANIIPVTPNNVGVAELVIGSVSHLSGSDFSSGLVAGAIMRACHLTISIVALPYAHWRLTPR